MKSQQLSNMLLIVAQRHHGQFDKGGAPYVLHPLHVMLDLQTDDEELQCIALGHDLIEDTFHDPDDGVSFLRSWGFSERVVEGILALTKLPMESYESYKQRVKANPDAVRVKMADIRHNSDIRRLKGVEAKDFARMERYHRLYLELLAITAASSASNEERMVA